MKCVLMVVSGALLLGASNGLSEASPLSGTRVEPEILLPSFHSGKSGIPVEWEVPPASGARGAVLRLSELPASGARLMAAANRDAQRSALQIGLERDLSKEVVWQAVPAWEPVPGGWLAQVEVVSPGAAAVRVAVVSAGLPEGTLLRYGSPGGGGEILGADLPQMRSQVDALARFWTATLSGDRLYLQWFVPGQSEAEKPRVPPLVAGVAHLFFDPAQPDVVGKALGDAASCNRDATCYTGELGAGFVAAGNAVARYTFLGCFGVSVCMCTGTLLADMDPSTQHAWFYTAAHCVNSQARANTLETYWSYVAPQCGVVGAGQNIRVGDGAELVARADAEDAVLLRLRGNLPAGVHFAGWDSRPIAAGTPLVAIHHPRGDSRKVSFGTFWRYEQDVHFGNVVYPHTATVTWNQGTLEAVSSGSGVFSRDGEAYYFRGAAMEGTESCGGGVAYYGPLERTLATFRPFLGGPPSGASHDYTGQWYNAGQARRGLSLFRLQAGGLFALWFRYDEQNRSVWYQLEDVWTGEDRLEGRVARFVGNSVSPVWAGAYTLEFHSATTATFTYTNVDGDSGTVTLTKGTP